MNRFFEFTSKQLVFLLILSGILLFTSIVNLVKGLSVTSPDSFRLSVSVGDADTRYAPLIRVDLNHSPADSLELLPGIGAVLAERIVAFRDSAGPFNSPEEVMKVHGIGFKLYERIKPYLEVCPW